jgi:hypothetical protein
VPTNKNAADVTVTIFGGLCSEMAPSDLPQGASPLTYDTDFDIGRAKTRDGLESVYTLVNQDALLQEQGSFLNYFLLESGTGTGVILLEN